MFITTVSCFLNWSFVSILNDSIASAESQLWKTLGIAVQSRHHQLPTTTMLCRGNASISRDQDNHGWWPVTCALNLWRECKFNKFEREVGKFEPLDHTEQAGSTRHCQLTWQMQIKTRIKISEYAAAQPVGAGMVGFLHAMWPFKKNRTLSELSALPGFTPDFCEFISAKSFASFQYRE